MPDRSYRDWPFLDDEHRTLAGELDAWAAEHVTDLPEVDEEGVDERCRALVTALADGGWLHYATPSDVR